MKISAKSRYALASLIQMGLIYEVKEPVTISFLSEKLGISKIFLEQVFSLLKRGSVVTSIKGAQGGYQLARPMNKISAYDVLFSIEIDLFQQVHQTVANKAPNIESVIQNNIFKELDTVIPETLKKITLESLVAKAIQYDGGSGMYFI